MSKLKRIIEFILALLNFLFHFKSIPDDETPDMADPYPSPVPSPVPPAVRSPETRTDPLFEIIP